MYPWAYAPLATYLILLKVAGRIPVILFVCCCLSGCVSGRMMAGATVTTQFAVDVDHTTDKPCVAEHLSVNVTRQF